MGQIIFGFIFQNREYFSTIWTINLLTTVVKKLFFHRISCLMIAGNSPLKIFRHEISIFSPL